MENPFLLCFVQFSYEQLQAGLGNYRFFRNHEFFKKAVISNRKTFEFGFS